MSDIDFLNDSYYDITDAFICSTNAVQGSFDSNYLNNLNKENIIQEGEKLSFPDSVVDYCKGMIGQPVGGIPKNIQKR